MLGKPLFGRWGSKSDEKVPPKLQNKGLFILFVLIFVMTAVYIASYYIWPPAA